MSLQACTEADNHVRWGLWDLFKWKLVPARFGGGRLHIRQFKDGWVRYHRDHINRAAEAHAIPAELLAGTAWIEVGGDPGFIDRIAYQVRSFDWSGPDLTDRMTVTRHPLSTSFGPVSMQLQTAAQTMGLNVDNLQARDWNALAGCLQQDRSNIRLVAAHLRQLVLHDFPDVDTRRLTRDQIRVVGARYNRGTGPSLQQIYRNTSYGDFLLRIWSDMRRLLRP